MKKSWMAVLALLLLATAASTLGPAAQQVLKPLMSPFPAGVPAPINISNSATDSHTPLIGVDGNGAVYAVWFENQGTRLFYFATNKSGQWSAPQYVDQIVYNAEEAGYPWMDVSPAGACHMIFQDGREWTSYNIYHAVYQNNSWSSIANVSNNDGGSCYAGVAFNPVDNYTYVVWQDNTGLDWGWNLLFRFRGPGGNWGTTQTLPLGGGYMPQIAIDAAGTAHVMWTTGHGTTLWYSKNQTPQNVATWSQPKLIKQNVGEEWSFAKIACDNAGNAYLIWMDGTVGNDEIFLRMVYSNGALGPEINVSQTATSSQEGAIAVDKTRGSILIAWKENNDIYVNAYVGGIWTGPTSVTAGLLPSKMPAVAVDKAGGAHLAFSGNINGNWEIIYMAILSAVMVTSPNGGEVWDPGTSHNITWISTGVPGNVRIQYSKDNGASFSTIVASTPNTGAFNWTIPNTPSAQCLVKVGEAATGSPSDVSDGAFTISGPIPCSYSIVPSSQAFSALGGNGGIDVTTYFGCNWTAASNDAWIIVNSGSNGSGNGKVLYAALANPNSSPRSGTITVAEKTFTVNQEGLLAGTTFLIPFGSLDNGNVNIANIDNVTATGKLRILDSSGVSQHESDLSIPSKGMVRSWDLAGNIYSHGKPLMVEITGSQALVGDNIKWAGPPFETVGAGFTCGPLSMMKGKEFHFPFSSFGQSSGYAVISNATLNTANLTIEVYDQTGALKKTSAFSIGPRGIARSWDQIGSIQAIADPALLRITSDQDVVVESVRWEQNKRGWGFAVFPTSAGAGTSFGIPFGSLDNGNINLANIAASAANVTLRVLNSSGQNVKEQAFTIPAKGVKRSWDIVGNIFSYGKPVTVEISSSQALVSDNIKWASPPYDTVGVGFTCGPLSLMKGKLFFSPFSSFGQTNGYAVLSNTTTSVANVTIEVFDQTGVLKKTSMFQIGSKGVARSWDYVGSIQAVADPAVLRITSDQDLVVEAVRLEGNKRGWGFAILPITN